MDNITLKNCTGFEWDAGNHTKNQEKHEVSYQECEQVFFNEPLLLFEDIKHTKAEQRLYVLGKTDANRKLFIAFTIRMDKIRVISARDMSKKEKKFYDQT